LLSARDCPPSLGGIIRKTLQILRNDFVASFVGVIHVLATEVRGGVARLHEIKFPAAGCADRMRLRVGSGHYSVLHGAESDTPSY